MLRQLNKTLHSKTVVFVLLNLLAFQQIGHAEPALLPVVDQVKTLKEVPASTTATEEAEDISEIIVESKPFKIPKALKKTLISMGITGLTLSDREGRIRLIASDGTYINPCLSSTKASKAKSAGDQPTHTCRFAGGLGEAHALIASRAGVQNALTNCDTCIDAGGASRYCNINTNKYGCSTQKKTCSTSCGD